MTEGTDAEVSLILSTSAERLPRGTIRSWASRGLLGHTNQADIDRAARTGDRPPAKRYKVADVTLLWDQMKRSPHGNPNFRRANR